jgi:hypothetical protein
MHFQSMSERMASRKAEKRAVRKAVRKVERHQAQQRFSNAEALRRTRRNVKRILRKGKG